MKMKTKMKTPSKLKKTPNMQTTSKFDDLKAQDDHKNKTIWTLKQPQKWKYETK